MTGPKDPPDPSLPDASEALTSGEVLLKSLDPKVWVFIQGKPMSMAQFGTLVNRLVTVRDRLKQFGPD